MENWMERLFRYFEPVELEGQSGEKSAGRGLVARLRGDQEDLRGSLAHQLGELCQPLYVFTGWLEEAAPGDVLRQGKSSYRVLQAGPLKIGGQALCMRVLLEKIGTEAEHGSL